MRQRSTRHLPRLSRLRLTAIFVALALLSGLVPAAALADAGSASGTVLVARGFGGGGFHGGGGFRSGGGGLFHRRSGGGGLLSRLRARRQARRAFGGVRHRSIFSRIARVLAFAAILHFLFRGGLGGLLVLILIVVALALLFRAVRRAMRRRRTAAY